VFVSPSQKGNLRLGQTSADNAGRTRAVWFPRQQGLLSDTSPRGEILQIPFLTIDDFYNFLGAMMIVLFIVGLVVVFVYEYEALRRSKA
jgi:hypothetical protein